MIHQKAQERFSQSKNGGREDNLWLESSEMCLKMRKRNFLKGKSERH
jgi:hypothetical protein